MVNSVVTPVASEDGILYVGVYGYDSFSEFELHITCEGYDMTCEELWATSFNDKTYLDIGALGGISINNQVPEGSN
jgi:hypothetical protein